LGLGIGDWGQGIGVGGKLSSELHRAAAILLSRRKPRLSGSHFSLFIFNFPLKIRLLIFARYYDKIKVSEKEKSSLIFKRKKGLFGLFLNY